MGMVLSKMRERLRVLGGAIGWLYHQGVGTLTMVGANRNPMSARLLADDMEAIHNSIMGHLELSPKYVQKFIDKECHDKLPTETYKDYCARLQGTAFNYRTWKQLCRFSWKKFETDVNPNDMDITALMHLFQCLFKTKNNQRNTSNFDTKLQNLANLRNAVMHDLSAARNPAALSDLHTALDAFIQEAGRFYSLSANETRDLQNELQADIQAGFSPGTKKLLYAKACMVKEGWMTMELFLQANFEQENLMFNMGKVARTAVFHDLEILLREGKNGDIFPYSEIFEYPEKFIIVSGVAGSGKSNLLENIALQFVKPQANTSARLQEFELLVYVQCRDHTTKTLSDVLIQQFSDVRTKLGEDIVIEALFNLRVLFLIDGYDEYSDSMEVLQQVIKKTLLTQCRIIITTRPHAVGRLKQLLARDNCNFVEFGIAPLTDLEHQLSFIDKYEPHLGHQHFGAVQKSFETLEEPLRFLFTEPLKLLQFCHVYASRPDSITKWTKPNDIAKATFRIYTDLVAEKLIDVCYPNMDIVIEDLFLIIYEVALNFLQRNTLTFTEGQFKEIQRKCCTKLRTEHEIKNLDVGKVLSCVFKMKRPITGKGNPTFSFNHKSDQEYFASKCVVNKMKTDNLPVEKILKAKETKTENAFLEVLQYVVEELSAESPELFKKRWAELEEALVEAGAEFSTWRDLVLSCSDNVDVVKRVAKAAMNDPEGKWEAYDGRDMNAIALMLPYEQPGSLHLSLLPDVHWKTHLAEIIKERNGSLSLVVTGQEPCDDFVEPLRNSKSRCTLTYFSGTISSTAGVTALAAAVTASTELEITLTTPLQLEVLNACGSLTVHMTLVNVDGGEISVQLPERPPAHLYLEDVTLGAWQSVTNMLLAIAPPSLRYKAVTLHYLNVFGNRNKMIQEELNRILVVLQKQGVRTEEEEKKGNTRWERRRDSFDGHFELHVNEDIHDALKNVSDLLDLRTRVIELNASSPEQLQADWPALGDELKAAGACYVDWRDLMLSRPDLEDLAQLAADALIDMLLDWQIRTGRDTAIVARMLPWRQPRRLEVRTSPDLLRGAPWGEVALHRVGTLWLDFPIYSHCDDLLVALKGTRVELEQFCGGIAEAGSVEVLAAAVTPSSRLKVGLLAPLSLGSLQGKCEALGVTTRPFGAGAAVPMPLPDHLFPDLRVTDIRRGTWKNVVHTVQSLAPVSNRFQNLQLMLCHLSVGELYRTVAALQRLGVRTSHTGPTRWLPLWGRWKMLHITDDLPNELALLN